MRLMDLAEHRMDRVSATLVGPPDRASRPLQRPFPSGPPATA
jgi:hypothetical protein